MNRLESVIADVEAGKPVDIRRVCALMALDAAIADQRFVETMAKTRDEADEQLLRR